MQALGAVARLQATRARAPLTDLLARYPSIDAPSVANVSTRRLQSSARRANAGAQRRSILGDYLATI